MITFCNFILQVKWKDQHQPCMRKRRPSWEDHTLVFGIWKRIFIHGQNICKGRLIFFNRLKRCIHIINTMVWSWEAPIKRLRISNSSELASYGYFGQTDLISMIDVQHIVKPSCQESILRSVGEGKVLEETV